jgi:O-antigen ligase
MYVNVAFLALFFLWYKQMLRNFEKVLGSLVFIFLLVDQYLLASRTSILTMGLLLLGFVVLLIVKRINKKQAVFLSLGLLFFVGSLVVLFPKVLNRFDSIRHVEFQFENKNPINHFNGEIKKENWNGLNTRLAIWTCALELIQKKPFFGTGLGDVESDLQGKYKDAKFYFALESNYNSHNQYLDILLSNGVLGLLFFLFFNSYVIFVSFVDENEVLIGIIVIFFVACTTENILSRNQGVILVFLLISMLFLRENKLKNDLDFN